MAAGLPCVTTDVPGCREAVRDGDNGLIVPAKDARALADALKVLILDPDLRARMGARGLERVQQEFSLDLINQQTLELYSDLGIKPAWTTT
jgi:glycosyltransferase involved in cell wall biosynthesis